MRNEDRLRAANVDEVAALVNRSSQPEVTNPVEVATPTRTVDLPSKGFFYPEDHPWRNKESIEIRFMTAKDEDILVNKSYLQKGVVLDKLIASVLLDKKVNLDTILSCDKSAIIVGARITGYGSEYITDVTCPHCFKNNSRYEFDLDLFTNEFPDDEKLKSAKVTLTDVGTFVLELPKSSALVELKLLNTNDEKRAESLAERKKKQNLPESTLTDYLKQIIVSVNQSDDSDDINSFIDSMTAFDAKYLRRMYSFIIPGIKNKQSFTCSYCSETLEVEVPLTKTFFWSD